MSALAHGVPASHNYFLLKKKKSVGAAQIINKTLVMVPACEDHNPFNFSQKARKVLSLNH